MNRPSHISVLMLERYNCGEVTAEEKEQIETALDSDAGLSQALADIRRSDFEFRNTYPEHSSLPKSGKKKYRTAAVAPIALGLCAAAALFAAMLPLFRSDASVPMTDRMKGGAELTVYLKTDNAKLPDNAVLGAGNTIQLAYMVSGNRYGVIFSIDGRGAVTMHYPYSMEGSTLLVSGKRTALEDAYTLDDAPDYEIFFFVIDDEPLNVTKIMNSAGIMALNPGTVLEQSSRVFKDYEIKTVVLRKE
ncbi:hypothetical protein [Breznakiella homolactica]|uniref:DUF4384 domain-containing protein n=1 Tax=Breznakiella homolactica TaxID=2798577 RepID=A0A7T7XNA4_9SPIR|nr:hypothetical protein [Breznakiella homolactica]QQO09490.1 hypothetical protein JFL75_00795 [Breznakiella homolactica]